MYSSRSTTHGLSPVEGDGTQALSPGSSSTQRVDLYTSSFSSSIKEQIVCGSDDDDGAAASEFSLTPDLLCVALLDGLENAV